MSVKLPELRAPAVSETCELRQRLTDCSSWYSNIQQVVLGIPQLKMPYITLHWSDAKIQMVVTQTECNLFVIYGANFSNLTFTVYEIQTFTNLYHKTEVSNTEKIQVTHKTTMCAQSGHRFHEHTHTVKHATVKQFNWWFCGRSDATLRLDTA